MERERTLQAGAPCVLCPRIRGAGERADREVAPTHAGHPHRSSWFAPGELSFPVWSDRSLDRIAGPVIDFTACAAVAAVPVDLLAQCWLVLPACVAPTGLSL